MNSVNCTATLIKILTLSLLLLNTHAQDVPQYRIQFENLPEDKRNEFYQQILEAKRLFSQQRIFEALEVISEGEKIIKNFPALLSLKGACHVEFRDFKSAEQVFKQCLKQEPENSGTLFNLGEISFVQADWKEAQKYFKRVMKNLEEDPSDHTYLLAELKYYIAAKKLNQGDIAKTFEEKYDYTFDSPIYYYINAVKEKEAENDIEFQTWLSKSRSIFRQQGALDAWNDTMVEAGYIRSFYGGGDRDENGSGGKLKAKGESKGMNKIDVAPVTE